jgi:type IV pilus assembly protein PilV
MAHKRINHSQQGVALIEALIAILIFSVGLLGLLGVQAMTIKVSKDSKYRSDASYLANQIISQMWVDKLNIGSYANLPTTTSTCHFTGAASALANVTNWISESASLLPGVGSLPPQIIVTTSGTAYTQVQVTICWVNPSDQVVHNFVSIAQINQ